MTGMPITPNMCRTPSLASERATRKYPSLGCLLKSMDGVAWLPAGVAPPPAGRRAGRVAGACFVYRALLCETSEGFANIANLHS